MNTKHLRKCLLVNANGTPAEQKDALVNAILETFSDPAKWPPTEEDRCKLLWSFYGRAIKIQETELAIKEYDL